MGRENIAPVLGLHLDGSVRVLGETGLPSQLHNSVYSHTFSSNHYLLQLNLKKKLNLISIKLFYVINT